MAKYKAIRSFSGIITMRKGMEKEINDDAVAQDLMRAGFVVALNSTKAEKADEKKADESSSPAPKKAGRKPKKEDD